MRGWSAALAIVLGIGGVAWSIAALQEEPFPHVQHQGLFPLCVGCHEGVPLGNRADFYPEPGSCDGCHDGVSAVQVTWTPPGPRETNVDFDHTVHPRSLESAGDTAVTCEACHSQPGVPRMSVTGEVQTETCFSCHAHESGDHYEDGECTTCHVPLAGSGFRVERIEALPSPGGHDDAGFLLEGHGVEAEEGDLARCATCHTAERCIACHVDVGRPEIQAMPPAPPTMQLPPAEARYESPATHLDGAWLAGHGDASSAGACATCHTQESCRACHVSPAPQVVQALPSAVATVAPGAEIERRSPGTHESFFFLQAHSVIAAGEGETCATCHVESFCTSCHDGPSDGGYHPPDFVGRHAAEAFGRSAECSNCHSTEVFCRSCHQEVGLTGFGISGPNYHDGQALWLFRHGQAARQNLESCASCHEQNDCTRCHGVLGAFKVNPHSADFDARRAWERSPRACLACHVRNPLIGSEP